ncbi:uncharacterized protein K02A2.6-like [Uranotaenia lowii]|uniref:uncharacterized protein K02A2.6-like n=1 Tax=Uranotaenia lowii TaxID=190385 RepID=UPI002479509C|nr:uncharacterized protein K02A2.6-like [Uranotaenia lowii]
MYLVGNKFTIKTDHKPLVSILGHDKGIPIMAAGRVQRWANFISGFKYKMKYVNSENNKPDYPSRAPVESWELWKEDTNYLNFMSAHQSLPVEATKLKKFYDNDEPYSKLREGILQGRKVDVAQGYANVFEELSVESGIEMRGYRVVIPEKLQRDVLKILHSSHLGINKMKSVARGSIWWPQIDSYIEDHAKTCLSCLIEQPSPPLSQLIPWELPDKPWARLHADFAGPLNGMWFLIVIDSYTKWPEVFATKSITTDFTITPLMDCMARFGLPDQLVTDNGTQFTATRFRDFLKANGIKQTLTAPGHPATNGAAENFVKTFKKSLKKTISITALFI